MTAKGPQDARANRPPPWSVPVPVRSSEFEPLYPADAQYNVEVDLGAIVPYGATLEALPADSILRTDLQCNPDTTVHGRLGSGRTGVYRDRYMKGVGRTLLAANWATPRDVVHHHGMLTTNGAIREFVISRYLIAKGAQDTVNACSGVLFKPLSSAGREFVKWQLRDEAGVDESTPGQWAGDFNMQGLTLKEAGFTRFSNLVWLSNHLDFYGRRKPSTMNLGEFLRTFVSCVGSKATSITPDSVAQAFFDSFERSFRTLHRHWQLGISWGSLHNNFGVDGRYLDIDRFALTGFPLVGVIGKSPGTFLLDSERSIITGLFECLAHVTHMRMLGWFFRSRLESIASYGPPVFAEEREFAEATAKAFRRLERTHLLHSDRKLSKVLRGWVEAEYDLDKGQRHALRTLVDIVIAQRRTGGPGTTHGVRRVPGVIARSALTGAMVPHVYDFMEPRPLSDEAIYINELLAELDSIGDRDRLLARLSEVPGRIQTYCRAWAPPCRQAHPPPDQGLSSAPSDSPQ